MMLMIQKIKVHCREEEEVDQVEEVVEAWLMLQELVMVYWQVLTEEQVQVEVGRVMVGVEVVDVLEEVEDIVDRYQETVVVAEPRPAVAVVASFQTVVVEATAVVVAMVVVVVVVANC